MKKYFKPELIQLNFKLSKKPICAEDVLSQGTGMGGNEGTFVPGGVFNTGKFNAPQLYKK